MDSSCRGQRTRLAAAGALAGLLLGLAIGGCGDDGESGGKAGQEPSEEYRVARAIRTFVVGVNEGDGEAACGVLTPERQREITARLRQRTCEKAIAAQSLSTSERELERLARSRVTKVDRDGVRGRAEIVTPGRGADAEEHTVEVVKLAGGWKIASQFFPGRLAQGRVPKGPPGPPRNPVEERKVAGVFERFRAALRRGDGRAGCRLRTSAGRRGAVRSAIELAGGRRQARREFGGLTCEQVSRRLQPPPDRIRRVVVDGVTARLTLVRGATYAFRKIGGAWRLDT